MSVPIHCRNQEIAEARTFCDDITFSLQDGGETLEALVAELARMERDVAPAAMAEARNVLPGRGDDGDIVLLGSQPPSITLGPVPRVRRAVPARLLPPMPRL